MICLLGAAAAWRTLAAADNQAKAPGLAIQSIELHAVHSNRLELAVHALVRSSEPVTIRSIGFESMRLNALPIYVSPVRQSMKLDPARPAVLRSGLVSVYYRDFKSMAPLREMMDRNSAQLAGRARITVELPLVPKLLLLNPAVEIVVPLSGTIPLTIPGGSPVRRAAIASIGPVDSALTFGRGAVASLRRRFGWLEELGDESRSSVVLIETTYALASGNESVRHTLHGLGFPISHNQLLVTAEQIEPWAYDPAIMHRIADRKAALDDSAYDIRIRTARQGAGPGPEFTLRSNQIRVARSSARMETALVLSGGALRRTELRRRDSDRNLALLEFVAKPPAMNIPATAIEAVQKQQRWGRLALFRFVREGQGLPALADIVLMNGVRKGDRIMLRASVDSTAFGSPVIGEQGVIGIVQDETSGMILSKALERLR